MMATENLKKHMEDIEKRRLTLYFHMQRIATDLNNKLYHLHIIIAVSAITLLLFNVIIDDRDQFLIMWSTIFSSFSFFSAIMHYLYIMENVSGKIYAHTCAIYRGYDDEYYILKKYNIGELDERLIRQFYINKTRDAERYICAEISPGWITWCIASCLMGAITLFILA